MIRNLKYIIICFLMTLSVVSYGQETVPDTAATDSTGFFSAAFKTFASQKPEIDVIPIIISIIWSVVFIALGVIFWRYLLRPFIMLLLNRSEYRDELAIVLRLLLIVFITYAVLIKIFNPGDELTYIILGTAGFAIAIGSFDVARNFINGLSIQLRRLIKPGDKIKLENVSGRVIRIGLQTTSIEHADGTTLMIPNQRIAQAVVEKQAAADSIAPVDVNFYLPPDIDIVKVKEIAHRAASLSRFVYLNKSISVNMTNDFSFGRSVLKLIISAYVLNIDYVNQFKSDITENVLTEIINKNILPAGTLSFSTSGDFE